MQLLNNIRNGRQDVTLSYEDGGESKTIALGSIIESDIENSMNIIPNTYMFAYTDPMILTVEKTELTMDKEGNVTGTSQRTNFGPYVVENMNFGIAEVPVTIVDLQKHVSEFKIEDSTGKNILASLKKDDEDWEITGNVIVAGNYIDVQIENEKLQGARLEVKYIISVDMDIEVNFDRTTCTVPKITGVVDFVNNNLSYNKNLGNNDLYWEVTTFQEVQKELAKQKIHDNVTEPKGTIDPTGTKYSTILMAKSGSDENNGNPLLGATEELRTVEITLEKVLSSTELTIDEIITSTVDTSEYNNIVEIIGFKYGSSLEDLEESPEENPDGGNPEGNPDEGNPEENPEGENPGGNPGGENPGDEENPPMRDRVRNEDGEAFIPGVDNDYAISETIVEHPPTGTTQIDTIYYVVAVIALVVLAVGVYGIKKFVIKK